MDTEFDPLIHANRTLMIANWKRAWRVNVCERQRDLRLGRRSETDASARTECLLKVDGHVANNLAAVGEERSENRRKRARFLGLLGHCKDDPDTVSGPARGRRFSGVFCNLKKRRNCAGALMAQCSKGIGDRVSLGALAEKGKASEWAGEHASSPHEPLKGLQGFWILVGQPFEQKRDGVGADVADGYLRFLRPAQRAVTGDRRCQGCAR